MNRYEIRQAVLEQMDWAPTQAAGFKAVVNRMINRGMDDLSLEAPYLLENVVHLITQADVVPASGVAGDSLTVNLTDRWVLHRLSGVAGATSWAEAFAGGAWDGRWVEVTGTDGYIRRRQIAEFFTFAVGPITFEAFTVTEPWPNNFDTLMPYRIYTPAYTLPGTVVEIRNLHVWDTTLENIVVVNRWTAEEHGAMDFQGQSTGEPQYLILDDTFQMPSPTMAPGVANAGTWDTPLANSATDNPGQFDFCFTYVWGRVPERDADTPMGLTEPLWESAPSPVSGLITATGAAGMAIRVTTPNIDHMLGFGDASMLRAGNSGFRKRLYARRYTAQTDATWTKVIESPQVFGLLAEIDGGTTAFNYLGDYLIDYRRRLKPIHGYRKVRFWPHLDGRYDVDIRVMHRAQHLDNDQDVPPLAEEGCEILVQKTLEMMYEMDGKPDLAQAARSRARLLLDTISKRYAAPATTAPTPRAYARASAGLPTPTMRSRRVTYTGVT